MVAASAPVQPGDILDGKYEVERVLGQGGMGVVVAAQHLVLRERVALKFLLPSAAARPEVAARFHREAQAAARIRSEHVVRVSDVGRMPDGVPYMVMEYLEGRDFEKILQREGVLDVPRAVDVILQACVALAEAHRAGIVHRDLKPANLFLTTRIDGEPCVKVLDFGISKVLDDEQEKLTSGHLGTPAYMPPEQLRAAAQVDSRADVWSLGVILFELLTGRYAFHAESLAELFAAILSDPAIPLRSIRPDAPPELEDAITRCLVKDRQQRMPDVGALAAAIAPFGGDDAPALLQRIARTLGQRSHTEAWSTRSRPGASTAQQVTPLGGGGTPPGAITPPGGPTPASLPSPVLRGTAVGTSYTLPGPSSKRPMLWIALAVAVLGLAAVSLLVWRSRQPATASSAARSSEAPAEIRSSPVPSTLATVESSQPSPPSSASANAAPSAEPGVDKPRAGAPKVGGRLPQPAKSAPPPPAADPPPPARNPDDYGGRK